MVGGIVDLNKENRWREILQQQKLSGKSQAEFCKEHQLIPHQFSYWKKVLKRRGKNQANLSKKKLAPDFVSLKLSEPIELAGRNNISSFEQIEISKITVRMSVADKSALACVIQSLGMAGC
jgi:hypothetical protein